MPPADDGKHRNVLPDEAIRVSLPGVEATDLEGVIAELVERIDNVPGGGEVDPEDIATAVATYLTENPSGDVIRVAVRSQIPATSLGGSITEDTATIAALSGVVEGQKILLVGENGANDGLWISNGDGTFTRGVALTDLLDFEAATYYGAIILVAADIEHDSAATAYRVARDGESTLTLERSDAAVVAAALADLETFVNRHFPDEVANSINIQSKWITYDPDFPTDGTATHAGGDAITENNGLFWIISNDNDKGGAWVPLLGEPWTRPTGGVGALLDTDVGMYDRLGISSPGWAHSTEWVLQQGNPAGGRDINDVTHLHPMDRSYRVALIATTRSGDNLTVLEADGTTTAVDIGDLTGPAAVLVLDALELVTYDDQGTVAGVEDWSLAEGRWTAFGAVGTDPASTGVGAQVELVPGTHVVITRAADAIAFDPGATGLVATDVAAAIAELKALIDGP